MLDLDSPRWAKLHHSYGKASGVPALLRALAAEPVQPENSELWGEIWDSLCHQGSAYSATYAAVPHLVNVAADLEPADQETFMLFAGAVALAADVAEMPDDLRTAYTAALEKAEVMAYSLLDTQPSEEYTVLYTLQAIAAFRGCTAAAELLEQFANEELLPRCPAERCGVELYVGIEGTKMIATVEDPAIEKVSKRTRVEPPTTPPPATGALWTKENVPGQLISLAERAGHPELAAKIRLSTGRLRCPKCGEPFPLWDTLLDPTDL